MKAKFFTLLGCLFMSLFALAQKQIPAGPIANFDDIMPGAMSNSWDEIKDPDAFAVVDNPLIDATNVSAKCLKIMIKDTYKPWGGPPEWTAQVINFKDSATMLVDKTSTTRYLHVKFLANKVGQKLGFNLVHASGQAVSFTYIVGARDTAKWIEVVYDLNLEQNMYDWFLSFTVNQDLDFTINGFKQETTYIDEIVINDVATSSSSSLPEKVLADFQTVSPGLSGNWGEITDPEALTIIDNPVKDGINGTAKCLKILQKESYKPWGNGDWYGAVLALSPELLFDKTNGSHFLHFKYYSNSVGTKMNFEVLQSSGVLYDYPLTVSEAGKWVEVVINLNVPEFEVTTIKEIVFNPNQTYQADGHTADEITYLDEIVINDIATTATPEPSTRILVDYETFTPLMSGNWGAITDSEALTVVDNPSKEAVNESAKCLKILQKASYQPWGNGDWYGAVLDIPKIDFDKTKASHYLHFKYLSFILDTKINFEILQNGNTKYDYPMTVSSAGKWVDVVIDLNVPEFTLTSIFEFFFSPNQTYQTDGHTADEITYLDDILINDVPTVITSVSPLSNNSLSIFPNPASEILNIRGITEETTASIYTVNGKLMQANKLFNNNSQININSLSKGIYVVRLQTGKNTVVEKFVKQ